VEGTVQWGAWEKTGRAAEHTGGVSFLERTHDSPLVLAVYEMLVPQRAHAMDVPELQPKV
jgi:hypothetical protein